MKLKEIYKSLLVEGRSKSISRKKLLSYFKTDGFNYHPNSTYIERSINGFNSNYGIIHPFNYTRKSQNTDNYYTLIIDNSEKWGEYPKRSKSVVGRSRSKKGIMGGNYIVIPESGANIGVCSDFDLWDSFSESNIYQLNTSFNEALDLISFYAETDLSSEDFDIGGDFTGRIPDDNYKRFKSYIGKMDRVIKNNDDKSYDDLVEKISGERTFYYKKLKNLIVDYIDSGFNELYPFLEHKLDPERNGFKTVKYGSNFNIDRDREIWTSSSCLLIRYSEFDSVINQLNNENK